MPAEPRAHTTQVVADLGARGVEHQLGLGVVGFGIGLDLLLGQRRARGVAARGVADQAGEVANQEDDLVPEVLQLAHLVEHHGVAEVDVGRRGVEAELDAQRHAGGGRAGELLGPLGLGQQFFHAPARDGQRLKDGIGDGVLRADGVLAHGARAMRCADERRWRGRDFSGRAAAEGRTARVSSHVINRSPGRIPFPSGVPL